MNSLPDNLAATLKDAYRVCDLTPLMGKDLRYFNLSKVRDNLALASVKQAIEDEDIELKPGKKYGKILFTGHRGCGKSTELRQIQDYGVSQGYQVIYIDAADEIDINDVQYTDLYLVIVKRVEEELRKLKLKFDPKLLKDFEDWFKQTTKETETKFNKWWESTAGIDFAPEIPLVGKIVLKLLGGIRGNEEDKTIIRQTLDRNAPDLMKLINNLLNDASIKLRQKYTQFYGFLIIFDSLDRVNTSTGKHLFKDYGKQLEINCFIIYTVPISIIHSINLESDSSSSCIMPMVDIYKYEANKCYLEHDEDGLNAMAKLIKKRVKTEAVFESEELLLELAKASGGHVRQLMQLMRIACTIARASSREQITVEDVTESIQREQQIWENQIPAEISYQSLAEVCLKKKLPKNPDIPEMLYRNYILEYGGSKIKRWYYVNPLLMQADDFKKALQTAQEQ
ncbi:ATP-binding protein [Nostoc sp. CHAB 5836]|uniref:ATP-binding protein n=1 Tax=Nostoc sp. CHAB 5836 TaxID=2780404 RepID=UPI001E500194|nr:ATP-binding protein [Nostoc sp. CHAB 5836]MCC5618864.1 ATP-binding protein [Nostoc sp. CHAB 5836]